MGLAFQLGQLGICTMHVWPWMAQAQQAEGAFYLFEGEKHKNNE